MKSATLVSKYDEWLGDITEYLEQKFQLDKISNDFFFFLIDTVLPTENKDTLQVQLKAMTTDKGLELYDMYFLTVSCKTLDNFILSGEVGEILTPDALKEFSWSELQKKQKQEEKTDVKTEEEVILEGH